jgi:hypothetical protein
MLAANVPDEFTVGYQARTDSQQIIEFVDPPETVEAWSRLITLQLFFHAAEEGSLERFYGSWRNSLHAACPGMTDTMVRGSVDGMPAIKGLLSCPYNSATGKPENLGAVLVQGAFNLLMVQTAFRRPMARDDRALVERVTNSLKICDQPTLEACSRRKAVGFVPRQ